MGGRSGRFVPSVSLSDWHLGDSDERSVLACDGISKLSVIFLVTERNLTVSRERLPCVCSTRLLLDRRRKYSENANGF